MNADSFEKKLSENAMEDKTENLKDASFLDVVKGLPFDPVQVYLDSYTVLFKNLSQKGSLSTEEKKNFQNQLFFDAEKENFQSYISEERNFFKGVKLLSDPVDKGEETQMFYVPSLNKYYWVNEERGTVTGEGRKRRIIFKISESEKDFSHHISFADKDENVFLKVRNVGNQTIYTSYFKDYAVEHKVSSERSEINIYRFEEGLVSGKDGKVLQGAFYKAFDKRKNQR